MNLGSRLPFPQQLPDRCEVVNCRRGEESLEELLDEEIPLFPRQERCPGKNLADRQCNVRISTIEQITHEQGKSIKRLVAVLSAVGFAHSQSRGIPAPQDHIMVGQIRYHIIRLSKEVGEWPFDYAHTFILSEEVQISTERKRSGATSIGCLGLTNREWRVAPSPGAN